MCTPLRIFVYGLMLCMLSCATGDVDKQGKIVKSTQSNGGFAINIINKTWFDLEIYDETRIIPHNNEKILSLPKLQEGLNGGYSVTYKVKLSDDIYINVRRAENIIIDTNQNSAIIESPNFYFESSYFVIKNDTKQTISLIKDIKDNTTVEYIRPIMQVNRYTYIPTYHDSPYIKPNNLRLYNLSLKNNDFLIETDQYKTIPVSLYNVAAGFIYEYTFDGKTVSLTDARPLYSIGEKGWIKNENMDANTEIAAKLHTADGNTLFIGQNKENPDARTAIIQKRTATGSLVWEAPRSNRNDSSFAYLTCAAHNKKTNTFLAGGAADMQGIYFENYSAYLRSFDDAGKTLWELGRKDFDTNCGPVQSVDYDTKKDVWRFCGFLFDVNENGDFINSYTGETRGDIKSIDASFTNVILNKIVCGTDGEYYIAGKEIKANGDIQTIVRKYDSNGKQLWQSNQLKSPSYYKTALLDAGQLVLGGTLGGKPFLQGIDTETGAGIWLRTLDDAAFAKTALVTNIERAKEYGFIISLCGVKGEDQTAPFVTARVNERGTL